MLAVEAWVRVTPGARSESPGLFVPDPVRSIRLAPNYSGWFAGVPVHTNDLGLRDSTFAGSCTRLACTPAPRAASS